MNWKEQWIAALDKEHLFENSSHRTRFKELLDCFADYPFFTKGLCKCMYLSAWDEEHFCIMLSMLTEMSLEHEKNTDEMRTQGDVLIAEQPEEEAYIYRLSNAFLDDMPFQLDDPQKVQPDILHIIQKALHASDIIALISTADHIKKRVRFAFAYRTLFYMKLCFAQYFFVHRNIQYK